MESIKSKSGARVGGVFTAECMRPYDAELAHRIKEKFGHDSPEYGAIPRYLVWTEKFHNVLTAEGLTHMLDVTLGGKTLIDPFYCVLYDDDQDPGDGDDYAVPGYTEVDGDIDNTERPTYVDVVSNKSVTNAASKAVFTFNAGATIHGAALVGGSDVKSNKTDNGLHVLLCGAGFGTPRAVVDDDVINLTYVVTAADDGV